MEKVQLGNTLRDSGQLMIHTMPGGRVEVIGNLKTRVVEVKDLEMRHEKRFYPSEYTEFLQGVADKAAKLCAAWPTNKFNAT